MNKVVGDFWLSSGRFSVPWYVGWLVLALNLVVYCWSRIKYRFICYKVIVRDYNNAHHYLGQGEMARAYRVPDHDNIKKSSKQYYKYLIITCPD